MTPTRTSAIALVTALLVATPAAAGPEAESIVRDLIAKAAEKGSTLEYRDLRYDAVADAVVLSDVNIRRDAQGPTHAASITLSGVSDAGEGKVAVRSMEIVDLTGSDAEDGSVAIAGLTGTGVLFDPAAADDSAIQRFDSIAMTDVKVSGKDMNFTLGAVRLDISDYRGDWPTAGHIAIEDITVPVSSLEDEELRTRFQAMGYEQFNLGFELGGRYDPDGETLTIEALTLRGTDMGTLSLSAELGGIPLEVLENLDTQREKLLETLTVKGLSLSFVNQSLVERAVDAQAKEMGVSADELKAQVSSLLPVMLSMLQNEAFQNKVSTAVTAFLEDPKSLRVTANPTTPVPATQLVGAAMAAPQTLPDVLSVEIEANR